MHEPLPAELLPAELLPAEPSPSEPSSSSRARPARWSVVTVVCARKPTVPPRGRVVLALSAALQPSIHSMNVATFHNRELGIEFAAARGTDSTQTIGMCSPVPTSHLRTVPHHFEAQVARSDAATRIRIMPLVSSMSSSMSSSLDSGLTVDGWPPNWAPTPAQQPSSGLVRAS
eukprot:CAMPEP_0181185774 /NCGR_PEP_ID=MMETSP1096-20121128/9687_1 /TAXON_ID=156174 ORGANISM="Chrysochromulina ericina, Strain CCMP281" /NCGR_SAMPLE_ID=MMETSP1096 /ASSEMBLY_ACC=CAM_ASM_000453 /LENGTH=172 /DNA_ID=CAMNT_0023274641 /DNA_START=412 /DNA_END=928 /DNA_ORIENTATION=+